MYSVFTKNCFPRIEPCFPGSRTAVGLAILAILTMSWTGCQRGSEPTYPVEGTILLDGKPLSLPGTVGTVLFTSCPTGDRESNYTARGIIQKDGTFRLSTFTEEDGAVAGRHLVAVTVSSLSQPSGNQASAETVLPSRYYSPKTSGLEVEVKPEKNRIDITLTRR